MFVLVFVSNSALSVDGFVVVVVVTILLFSDPYSSTSEKHKMFLEAFSFTSYIDCVFK